MFREGKGGSSVNLKRGLGAYLNLRGGRERGLLLFTDIALVPWKY